MNTLRSILVAIWFDLSNPISGNAVATNAVLRSFKKKVLAYVI
jgi:hypothetical protein